MDHDLERAISLAGRYLVFGIMRAAGWSGYDMPPKYAWWEAVKLAEEHHNAPLPTRVSMKAYV